MKVISFSIAAGVGDISVLGAAVSVTVSVRLLGVDVFGTAAFVAIAVELGSISAIGSEGVACGREVQAEKVNSSQIQQSVFTSFMTTPW
jgi:hypothetical protein